MFITNVLNKITERVFLTQPALYKKIKFVSDDEYTHICFAHFLFVLTYWTKNIGIVSLLVTIYT